MMSLRSLTHSLLVFAVTLSSLAQSTPAFAETGSDIARSTLIARSTDPTRAQRGDLKIETSVETLDRDQVAAKLDSALASEPANSLTIVSTDVDSVIAQSAKSKIILMPFGRAIKKTADIAGGINSYIRNYPAYAAEAISQDKIGFAITVFAYGNETVRWMHVANASTFQISANLIYTALWTSAFLNKDTWSNVTRPIQLKWRKLFKMSQVIPEHTSLKDMGIKFLSGATLSVALNSGRASIVGIDLFMRNTLDWSHVGTIGMPLMMGVAMTSVGFSWSELSGSIKEEMYPRAKRIVKLVMNSRSVLTSLTASTAMLLNPATFGHQPWVIVSVSGAVGALTFMNAPRLIPRVEAMGKRIQRALPGYKPMTCEALF